MKKNSVYIILGILFSLNILAWLAVYDLWTQGLEVIFFDVGQGDAAFIETPERQQILIDGGPNGQVILEKLGEEMPFWDRTIDLVVLTHPEKDHMAGLIEVLKKYKIENILWTGVVRDTAEYKEWQKLIKEEGANIVIAKAGMLAYGGPASQGKPGLNTLFDILYPFEGLEGKELKDSNDSSIIAKLTFGETSFLFTGDATKSVERQLLHQVEQLNSDVLKVGHHGSKTSTSREFVEAVSPEIAVISASREFVEAVSPEIAVISAGKNNSYGHPHQEVLDNLAGARIMRTDLEGGIKLKSDGVFLQRF
ncbi:MAG: MBL fold metallo-hydrolase [Candidatus Nealsonbacteria bacterium]|nr:MBL fold metallo-hydrolase [Candidatus Nealsonbacteria bacterium]